MDELIFNLGSIINPKTMLKIFGSNPEKKLNIFKTFNYLYKFSLERLQHFLNNESLFLLLCEYLRVNKFNRIHKSSNMSKYRFAYYEACTKMLANSSMRAKFEKIFDFDDLTRVPDDAEFNEGQPKQVEN